MKILHLSWHTGCTNEVQNICDYFNLEVQHLNPKEEMCSLYSKDISSWNLYITRDIAEHYWNYKKDYFNQFDCIITSDTVPLSRVFLQDNHWQKKIIIWGSYRLDYPGNMDSEYYDLLRESTKKSNVVFAPYSDIEQKYADQFNIKYNYRTINPIGKRSNLVDVFKKEWKTSVDTSIDKKKTFFLPARHNENILNFSQTLNNLNIKHYSGKYDGPNDLRDFKGVIHIPYAWSAFMFFENIQNYLTTIVPSLKFYTHLINTVGNFWLQDRWLLSNNSSLMDYYHPSFSFFIEYFDNLEELKELTQKDFSKNLIHKKLYAKYHEEAMLARWKEILFT